MKKAVEKGSRTLGVHESKEDEENPKFPFKCFPASSGINLGSYNMGDSRPGYYRLVSGRSIRSLRGFTCLFGMIRSRAT